MRQWLKKNAYPFSLLPYGKCIKINKERFFVSQKNKKNLHPLSSRSPHFRLQHLHLLHIVDSPTPFCDQISSLFFFPWLFIMPFTSDRKNLIREVEMTILLADNDDDKETVKELVGLHHLFSCSRFVNDQVLRVRDDHGRGAWKSNSWYKTRQKHEKKCVAGPQRIRWFDTSYLIRYCRRIFLCVQKKCGRTFFWFWLGLKPPNKEFTWGVNLSFS